jgi:5-methylcytosine-specific restriction enzyme A
MLYTRTLAGQHRLVHGPAMYPGWLPACRGCGGVVIKPRRSFCSADCVDALSIANDPAYARRAVARRDSGVCAGCGLDCGDLDNALMRLRHTDVAAWIAECDRLGLSPSERGRSVWEMDHIVPVTEGGGACGLENLRTLCIWCHRGETAELRKRRAA